MAGRGPTPIDPAKKTRTNRTSTNAKLYALDDPDIPEMPNPDHYIPRTDGQPAAWNPAVATWWIDIWSSPMSAEFSQSDIHGLYLGCKQLHESLNSHNKATEQAAFMTKFEQTIRNFGLNPMSRRSLQWEIDRGSEAETRTKAREAKLRETKTTDAPFKVVDPRQGLSG